MAGNKRLLPFLVLFAAMILSFPSGTCASEGAPVGAISFQAPSSFQLSYEELSGLVALRPGDPLSREAVQESIRKLQEKAIFREVTAYIRDDGGKVNVLFYLRPVPLIVSIDVEGESRLPAARIIAETRLRRGSLLPEKNIPEVRRAVESFMARKGFTNGKAKVVVSCDALNGAGRVRIVVEEGRSAKVDSVSAPGVSLFSPEQLRRIMGAETGTSFDYERWEKGIPMLRREYQNAGYLTVHVEDSAAPCEEGGGMCAGVYVEEGKRFDIRWEGMKRFSSDRLARVAGIFNGEETTGFSLAVDIEDKIRSFYEEEGYLRATVAVTFDEESGGTIPMTVTVNEGMRGFIKKIRFEGNNSIGEDVLHKHFMTREQGMFHWFTGSGKYNEEEWRQDINGVVGHYQSQGYVLMKVTDVDSQWDGKGGITKVVHIDEGTRIFLREIHFEGNDHFLRQELLSLMRNKEGRFVDYFGLEHDQEAIAARYHNSGFLDAEVKGTLDFEPGTDNAAARFQIQEGQRFRLGSVVVRGNIMTDPAVVLRRNPIERGAFAGNDQLIEFQQSVYRTGLYKSVRMLRVKKPAEGVVDLVVDVEEAMFMDLEFGAGYGTETGVRGSISARERNINGLGRSISGLIMVGEKEQNYQAGLREPYIFGSKYGWEGLVTISRLYQDRPSFSIRREVLIVGIQEDVLERSTLSFQYEYSIDKTFDVVPGAVITERDQGRANLGILRGMMVLDFRDDPFNPKRGIFLSGTAELASHAIASEVDYWMLSGQVSVYQPLFRWNSLALSARAGAIMPYGSTEDVPIQKRFFAGGRTTVRGFQQDSLGPKGSDGAPTGGNYQLILNAEVRFPLDYSFLFAIFLDAGSVWRHRDSQHAFDLRKSAGVGLRYITPVGPISVDYGWKLDRRSGESPGEISFTIGMVF
ncbi:MAG: outer membrane protein assembly factor BamA [Syntrophorhabdaceae bacterium]|nr:outer membrane protein assembly factor BamA [Syntrophorhabdaceae bacterium]